MRLRLAIEKIEDEVYHDFIFDSIGRIIFPKKGEAILMKFQNIDHFVSFINILHPEIIVGLLSVEELQKEYMEEFGEYPKDSCIICITYGEKRRQFRFETCILCCSWF